MTAKGSMMMNKKNNGDDLSKKHASSKYVAILGEIYGIIAQETSGAIVKF